MRVAYVDSSCPVAVALREPGHEATRRRLNEYDSLFSSNLLEAELRSVLTREGVETDCYSQLGRLEWVWPDRVLTGEFELSLSVGFLRGADLWHVANALYLRERLAAPIDFLTLDDRQREVAAALGLETP